MAEWVWENFDVDNYFTAEELIYDVKERFVKDMTYFPIQAEDNIKEIFQDRRERHEMEERVREQRQLEEYVGAPMQSITDEIIQDLRKPEIESVVMDDIKSIRETVVPPPIEKLTRDTFFGRLSRGIAKFLRLRKK